MQADQAIRRVSRDVAVTWAIHIALGTLVLVLMLAGSASQIPTTLLIVTPCTLWVLLAINGMRETRNAMQWPGLIASGQIQEAERQIEGTIRRFSMLRSIKLLSLHQLSVVRMAQHNWADALALSRAIMAYRHGKDQTLPRASLLVLAGAAVKVGDLPEAYRAIGRLRTMSLTLDEQLTLLAVECAYLAKIGAWESLVNGIDAKARMCELMPSEASAQAQAYLALGARHGGRGDWESYLVERCKLLVDPAKLIAEDEAFCELWPEITL